MTVPASLTTDTFTPSSPAIALTWSKFMPLPVRPEEEIEEVESNGVTHTENKGGPGFDFLKLRQG